MNKIKKIFPKVFTEKMRISSIIGITIACYLNFICLNGIVVSFLKLPKFVDTSIYIILALYCILEILFSILNYFGIIKIENS